MVAFVLSKDRSPPGSKFKAVSSGSGRGRNTMSHEKYFFPSETVLCQGAAKAVECFCALLNSGWDGCRTTCFQFANFYFIFSL